ncbi:MAG: hypothetical protein K2W95_35295 [Candidatus Obscuribacterales bacterium]|nr:hypothetical protein [Candidatus Obscuribacterales bacterium]
MSAKPQSTLTTTGNPLAWTEFAGVFEILQLIDQALEVEPNQSEQEAITKVLAENYRESERKDLLRESLRFLLVPESMLIFAPPAREEGPPQLPSGLGDESEHIELCRFSKAILLELSERGGSAGNSTLLNRTRNKVVLNAFELESVGGKPRWHSNFDLAVKDLLQRNFVFWKEALLVITDRGALYLQSVPLPPNEL